jgi:hypothetical protein
MDQYFSHLFEDQPPPAETYWNESGRMVREQILAILGFQLGYATKRWQDLTESIKSDLVYFVEKQRKTNSHDR